MRRLILTHAAIEDLASIMDYLTRESGGLRTGKTVTDKLVAQCKRLAELPGTLGRPRPELLPDLRSFPAGSYIIFFRYLPAAFEVVHILHARRDIPAVFQDDGSG